jgi:signal transduction histidine kinase
VQFTTANGLAQDSVLSVCQDMAGNVWASTGAGTVHRFAGDSVTRFDSANGLPGSPVTAMIPAADGGIWLGTDNGTILRGQSEFATVSQVTRTRPVLALYEGASGRLWVGSAGGGLSCIAKGRSATWTSANGLPNDVVAGIVEDLATNLWITTGSGIYRVASDAVQKSVTDPDVPLVCKLMSDTKASTDATMSFGGVRALMSPDGKLWFATADGLLNIDARRPENDSVPLPPYIESVAFNARAPISVLPASNWAAAPPKDTSSTAPVDLRSFEVHFTSPSFAATDKIRFRHKLEGSDTDWVEDNVRFARYGRLSYGNYRFRVAAHSGDGVWQEAPDAFAFVVPTPLYFQAWAIVLYGVAAVAFVAGIVRVVSHRRLRFRLAQLEQQQSLERERMRIARDMHDEIGSKLTKISFLSEHACIDAKSDGALSRKIGSIAATSRELLKTMDEIVWVVNPRNDSLEHLTAYLSHYADEYFQNTSVNCELRLPQAVSHVPVSSDTRHNLFLAFEEALNNVLKHSGASEVKVEMALNTPKFEIIVTDNGRGFESSRPDVNGQPINGTRRGGDGLKNMRQRLADIEGECLIQSRVGAGTTVRLGIQLAQKAQGAT